MFRDEQMTTSGFTVGEYKKFMYNPDNSHRCKNCPENEGFDSWQDRLPCGQWHCWVDRHCRLSD